MELYAQDLDNIHSNVVCNSPKLEVQMFIETDDLHCKLYTGLLYTKNTTWVHLRNMPNVARQRKYSDVSFNSHEILK